MNENANTTGTDAPRNLYEVARRIDGLCNLWMFRPIPVEDPEESGIDFVWRWVVVVVFDPLCFLWNPSRNEFEEVPS